MISYPLLDVVRVLVAHDRADGERVGPRGVRRADALHAPPLVRGPRRRVRQPVAVARHAQGRRLCGAHARPRDARPLVRELRRRRLLRRRRPPLPPVAAVVRDRTAACRTTADEARRGLEVGHRAAGGDAVPVDERVHHRAQHHARHDNEEHAALERPAQQAGPRAAAAPVATHAALLAGLRAHAAQVHRAVGRVRPRGRMRVVAAARGGVIAGRRRGRAGLRALLQRGNG